MHNSISNYHVREIYFVSVAFLQDQKSQRESLKMWRSASLKKVFFEHKKIINSKLVQ